MTAAALRDRRPLRVDINGEPVTVRVRESSRARTTRLMIGAERPLEIIVPVGTADEEIVRAVAARREWIEKKRRKIQALVDRADQLGLDEPGRVWMGGEPLLVERRPDSRAVANLADERLVLGGAGVEAQQALLRWYRRTARARLLQSAYRHADRLDLTFARLAVREQRTRWGSCSRRGNLSFNWRLIIAPPEVLEYVVVHELCHLRVPNHSKAFWRLLEGALSGWHHSARWLREHGSELRAYTPRP